MEGPSSELKKSELPHLSTFVRVAELGSFTATAAELGMSQAAVSQRIALLEKELSVSLFDRGAGRIRLSESGRRIYAYARQIIELHRAARRALGGRPAPVSGDLQLAASSVPGECVLPSLLSSFHDRYPGVHVRATVGDSESALSDVEKGNATLGLVGRKSSGSHLEYRPLGADCLVLVVPPRHRWASPGTIALADLRGEPLILREPGSGSRSVLLEGLERAGLPASSLNVTLELGSNAAIKDAVGRGLGVSFLSRMALRKELDTAELLRVEVGGLDLERSFHLVFDRRRPLPRPANAFLDFVAATRLAAVCRGTPP